jgi:hypothetical protein
VTVTNDDAGEAERKVTPSLASIERGTAGANQCLDTGELTDKIYFFQISDMNCTAYEKHQVESNLSYGLSSSDVPVKSTTASSCTRHICPIVSFMVYRSQCRRQDALRRLGSVD